MSTYDEPWYCREWDCRREGHHWDENDVCTQCGTVNTPFTEDSVTAAWLIFEDCVERGLGAEHAFRKAIRRLISNEPSKPDSSASILEDF